MFPCILKKNQEIYISNLSNSLKILLSPIVEPRPFLGWPFVESLHLPTLCIPQQLVKPWNSLHCFHRAFNLTLPTKLFAPGGSLPLSLSYWKHLTHHSTQGSHTGQGDGMGPALLTEIEFPLWHWTSTAKLWENKISLRNSRSWSVKEALNLNTYKITSIFQRSLKYKLGNKIKDIYNTDLAHTFGIICWQILNPLNCIKEMNVFYIQGEYEL